MDFVLENTARGRAPLVPELELHLAAEATATALWHATEAWLAARNVEPPFWAFAWAGGQALARHLLDHPNLVRGKVVLDVASGGGIVALAAARAGAARVVALDTDPLASLASAHNARLNALAIETLTARVEDCELAADVVTAGDVFYDAAMSRAIVPWLRARAVRALVLVGDPGRTYRPDDLEALARYDVPVDEALEGRSVLATAVMRVNG